MKQIICFIGGLLVLLGWGLGLEGASGQAQTEAKPLRVLFIGNSLTYTNDMPAILEAMARESGQRPLVYKDVSLPDFSLEDHWNQGDARKAIAVGGWDVVIMQQGPSALPESRELLLDYAGRFAREIRQIGARPAMYMVWPAKVRKFDFNGVSSSYREAALAINGMLFPVGDAWQAAWKIDPKLPLYSGDDFHPAEAGSYLAAAVMYEQLFGRTSNGLPHRLKLNVTGGAKIKIPRTQAEILQTAATTANRNGSLP